MEMNENKILFDPGYAPIVIDALGQVGYVYYTFSAIPNVKLKRLNFAHTFRKLEHYLKINISFYLGCLLWASYISQFENKEIEGNKLLGEECSEEEYTSEINFLIDFVSNQFPRDVKYFQSKTYEADERYLSILETYKQFLILNSGFVNCSNTNQIVMPENLKKPSKEDLIKINEEIQKAIKEKDVTQLLECFNLIF